MRRKEGAKAGGRARRREGTPKEGGRGERRELRRAPKREGGGQETGVGEEASGAWRERAGVQEAGSG